MTGFILRAVCFILLQGLVFALVIRREGLPNETGFLAATIDKHRRLEQAPSPRLILVGGSNLPFGIHSPLIESELECSVVNMGLIASAGIDYSLNEVEPSVRPGDWVLLSLEYELFSGATSLLNLAQLIELRPSNFRYVPVGKWRRFLDEYGLSVLGGHVRRCLDLAASPGEEAEASYEEGRERFNLQGDYTAHYGRPSEFHYEGRGDDPGNDRSGARMPIDLRMLDRIRRFTTLCEERGAFCAYSFPPQSAAVYEEKARSAELIGVQLGRVLGLRLLDAPEDQIYPQADFFDTAYHLTREGGRRRTERIAAALVNAFEAGR